MKVTILKNGGPSAVKAAEMLKDGTAHGHPLTKKQKRYFGMLSHKKADNGASISSLDSNTIQFNGPSHENGGIPINYSGNNVEVEGGETGYFSPEDQALHVMGNMYNPLTGRKFKQDSKILAKKENKAKKFLDKGTELVNNSNPYDKWGQLTFNSGKAMMFGGAQKVNELQKSKEHLATLQKAMLDTANEMGADPKDFSKGKLTKAKYGLRIAADGDKLSLAQKNNNPGNMKYAHWMKKYGAIKGDRDNITNDGTYYAKFPTIQQGQQAMKHLLFDMKYKNMTVDDAINNWTQNKPYDQKLWSNFKGRTVSSLSPDEQNKLLDVFTQGEDSKKYNWSDTTTNPVHLTHFDNTNYLIHGKHVPNSHDGTTPPDWRDYLTNDNYTLSSDNYPTFSNAKGLNLTQVLPEAYAFATNKVEPVQMQQYNPKLFQPYQVSFQDRINRNQGTFNALRTDYSQNPEALSTMAGQLYGANSDVAAEEFRTNQGITNDIENKNVQLLNDAQLKNIDLRDLQYTRQSEARSNTKDINQSVLNSISSKVLQKQLENRTLQAYENLYPHYRFDPMTGQAVKVGAPGQDYISWGHNVKSTDNTDSSIKKRYDKTGNLQSTEVTTPSALDVQSKYLDNQNKSWRELNNKMNISRLMKIQPIKYNR